MIMLLPHIALAPAYLITAGIAGLVVELIVVVLNQIRYGTWSSPDQPTISTTVTTFGRAHLWILVVLGSLLWHFFGG